MIFQLSLSLLLRQALCQSLSSCLCPFCSVRPCVSDLPAASAPSAPSGPVSVLVQLSVSLLLCQALCQSLSSCLCPFCSVRPCVSPCPAVCVPSAPSGPVSVLVQLSVSLLLRQALCQSFSSCLCPFCSRQTVGRAYTKVLRVVKNMTWQKRITTEVLYAGLPKISTTIREAPLAVIAGDAKMKLLANWFCGNRSMAKGASEDRLAHL